MVKCILPNLQGIQKINQIPKPVNSKTALRAKSKDMDYCKSNSNFLYVGEKVLALKSFLLRTVILRQLTQMEVQKSQIRSAVLKKSGRRNEEGEWEIPWCFKFC